MIKALSLRQPNAWLIKHGIQTIENRNWNTSHRGVFFIHASSRIDIPHFDAYRLKYGRWINQADHDGTLRNQRPNLFDDDGHFDPPPMPDREDIQTGGVVGRARLTRVVHGSDDRVHQQLDRGAFWYEGPYGFVISDAEPVDEFYPCKGRPYFFEPQQDDPEAVQEELF